jgi:hypothetical protein
MSETKGKPVPGWVCKSPGEEDDHDWEYVSDWYGDPGVIGGTADCSRWVCRACGEEMQAPPPSDEDDFL